MSIVLRGNIHIDIRRRHRGSLTVEAALILPLFMLIFLAIVSIPLMFMTGMRIRSQMFHTAERLAKEYPVSGPCSISEVSGSISDGLLPEDNRRIRNGSEGIDLSESDVGDREYICLFAGCDLVPETISFGLVRIPFSGKCLVHAWCGYDRPYDDEVYVYVTEGSSVYHLSRQCSHLNVTVRQTTGEEISDLRNDNGNRYRACLLCHSSLSDERLYVTPEGDRYHNTRTCSGLKRTVRTIKLREVNDRRPCIRCGR